MKILTKYFGEIDIHKDNIINFPYGIFGFESSKEFILLKFEEDNEVMMSLQSTDEPDLAFVLVNPLSVYPDYNPNIEVSELAKIGLKSLENAYCYGICVLGQTLEESTINLKSPIVLNTESKLAIQVFVGNSEYKFKHKIGQLNKAVK